VVCVSSRGDVGRVVVAVFFARTFRIAQDVFVWLLAGQRGAFFILFVRAVCAVLCHLLECGNVVCVSFRGAVGHVVVAVFFARTFRIAQDVFVCLLSGQRGAFSIHFVRAVCAGLCHLLERMLVVFCAPLRDVVVPCGAAALCVRNFVAGARRSCGP